jgi:hypothetical protein
MLSAEDVAIKEMAAFALGRLAQNTHNQAGIVQSKGLLPLLDLLESKHYNLQHNAAFALYGLSDNEDNVPWIIKHGGLQKLVNCEERLQVQASKVSLAAGRALDIGACTMVSAPVIGELAEASPI